jgi:hypothetical protein
MNIVFRTLGPWGAGKGANLQPAEVDTNFWEIAQAIVHLTASPALPVGIASIVVSGTQMTIHLTDGTVLGPYTLPVLTFRWRDEWHPSTSYAALDVVKVTNTGIYMVQISHTTGAAFDPNLLIGGNPAYLMLFGSADASLSALPDVRLTALANLDILHWVAADSKWENVALGSISGLGASQIPANLTTGTALALGHTLSDIFDYIVASARGTLFYRGATGWLALAPGTAGQVLSTGGAGNDPVWVAAATPAPPTTASVAAAGTDQASATQLTAAQSYVSGATGTNGVRIGTALMIAGTELWVANEHLTNMVSLYPPAGAMINSQAVNAAISIPANSTAVLIVKGSAVVRTVP